MKKRLPVKERLVETASRLFYEKGYNRTGINEILEKSEVAKASMYQHFRSKEEICLAYLRRKDEGFISDLKNHLDTLPKGKERIMGLFSFLKEFYHQDGFRGCWCLNTISEIPKDDKEINAEIRTQKNNFRALIYALVKENLKTKNEKRLADRLYLLYEGAIIESQVHTEIWPIEEAEELASAII
ncbi:MAG: TetR/AcrR family transcriptional regulator [Bacteroidota bacterium]